MVTNGLIRSMLAGRDRLEEDGGLSELGIKRLHSFLAVISLLSLSKSSLPTPAQSADHPVSWISTRQPGEPKSSGILEEFD